MYTSMYIGRKRIGKIEALNQFKKDRQALYYCSQKFLIRSSIFRLFDNLSFSLFFCLSIGRSQAF